MINRLSIGPAIVFNSRQTAIGDTKTGSTSVIGKQSGCACTNACICASLKLPSSDKFKATCSKALVLPSAATTIGGVCCRDMEAARQSIKDPRALAASKARDNIPVVISQSFQFLGHWPRLREIVHLATLGGSLRKPRWWRSMDTLISARFGPLEQIVEQASHSPHERGQ